jgi:hypothetical protein
VAVLALHLELAGVDVVAEEDRLARALEDPVSLMTGAVIESAGDFACCAWPGPPPNASRAASAVAPTPPTTRAIVRIIDPR